jgi:hypothetical protein
MSDSFSTNALQTAWRITTTELECRLELAGGELRWQLARLGADALPFAWAPLASIMTDGQTPHWRHGEQIKADQTVGGPSLTVALQDAHERVRFEVTVELFDRKPFVRTSALLHNTSDQPVTVTDAEMLHLAVQGAGPHTLFHVEQFSWPYRSDFFSQQQAELVADRAPLEIRMGSFPSHYWAPTSCAWFALRAGLRDEGGTPLEAPGLVAGIEFNGKSRLVAERDAAQITLASTIDDLAHTLAPGASFELPACFVGCFVGDWDEAGYVTQCFAEAHVHPPMPDDRYPWVQYNSWRYGQEINEAQQIAVIERCAELGLEVFVVDLGWARQIGDWRPDPAKFPNGLRPLAERAHALGMKFGVHLALAQMDPNAPAARAHPEWLIHTGDDYYGAGPICLGHTPCREWLVGEIVRLIDEEGLDYIIQDGEDMVKRCGRTDHTHAPGDSNYANSHGGIDQVIAAVRAAYPALVVENCEDGGCMMTYRMARLYHTSITVDNISTYPTRQGIYGASYPFSPRYSVRYMQDDPTPYTLRSALFGGPLIFMHRVTDWDDTQMADAKAAIAQYKQLRTLVRDAKIIHLLPPRANVAGGGWGWDAIQAVAPDKRRSVVMVYRAQGGEGSMRIRPRGLEPNMSYAVRFTDRPTTSTHTAASLAADGIDVALGQFGAEMVWLEAV